MILVTTLALCLFFAVMMLAGLGYEIWPAIAVLVLCAWLFSSLTIQITADELQWRFGLGIIRNHVALKEIASAEAVRNRPSWGIHWSPRTGWLYNVSGFDAVLVTLKSGKRFTLGTDEPQVLAARLADVIRECEAGFKA